MVANSDESETLRTIVDSLDQVGVLAERTGTDWDGWTVHGGSQLAEDDARTDPFRVSHAARLALVVAVDHLQALRSSLMRGHPEITIHTHAQFTLIRAALENASQAVWLLGAPLQFDRVKRTLALYYGDYKSSEKLTPLLNQPAIPDTAHQRQKIDDLLRSAGVPESGLKQARQTTHTEIVHSAGELTPIGGDFAQLIWSLCSSLAHGGLSGTLLVLNREITASDGTVALGRFTGSIPALSRMTSIALKMADEAFGLYVTRASAPG